MKIISWNVNGFRALDRKGDFDTLLKEKYDLILLQETKVEEDQLPKDFQSRITAAGYIHTTVHASRERKGHAGSMTLSKTIPDEVIHGFTGKDDQWDQQGRTITLIFKNHDCAVVNCYFPNGGSKSASLEYKLSFYAAMLRHAKMLEKKYATVIIAGDWNVCHHAIDIARPEANKKSIGFLPEERAWLTKFEAEGWTDLWRHHNTDTPDVYTWWSYRAAARDRNVGWRIDYIWINTKSLKNIQNIEVLGDIMGSDHCPVVCELQNLKKQ